MQIGNIGTAGFTGEYRGGSGGGKNQQQSHISRLPSKSPLSSSFQETPPELVISTTGQIQNLMTLPPASYVAELYKQNQE